MSLISEKCRYSYYPAKCSTLLLNKNGDVSWEYVKKLLNSTRITTIIGYTDGIIFVTKGSPLELYITTDHTYFAKYDYHLLRYLWDINDSLKEIICDYLGQSCTTKEDMEVAFMAKILGGREWVGT